MSYILVAEFGSGRMYDRRFETAAEAQATAKKTWSSWILFSQEDDGALVEMESGGLGWGHAAIRKHSLTLSAAGNENERAAADFPPPPPLAPSHYMLICEVGTNKFEESTHATEKAARAAAKRLWCSWVLYRATSPSTGDVTAGERELQEVAAGGMGFAHESIRKHAGASSRLVLRSAGATSADAAAIAASSSSSSSWSASPPAPLLAHGVADATSDDAASTLRGMAAAAAAVEDPALAQPLRDAVDRLERAAERTEATAVGTSAPAPPEDEPEVVVIGGGGQDGEGGEGGEGGKGGEGGEGGEGSLPSGQPQESDEPLRSRFGAALSHTEDARCASALVTLLQTCAESGGADELVDMLVKTLEEAPPTDAEMKRLRVLQEAYVDGLEGYAAASAWLAVRTLHPPPPTPVCDADGRCPPKSAPRT